MLLISLIFLSAAYASLLEYLLHRYVMHRSISFFQYPFVAHALTHHRIFKADQSYHLTRETDRETIPMAWWNGPVLVAISAIPPTLISLTFDNWTILGIAVTAVAFYYCTYEYIHWCMHLPLPRRRLIEQAWLTGRIFYRLNGHHILHHRYMNQNFNVVWPLWDWVFGTLLRRSKIAFNQVRGPGVPDVQPSQPST